MGSQSNWWPLLRLLRDGCSDALKINICSPSSVAWDIMSCDAGADSSVLASAQGSIQVIDARMMPQLAPTEQPQRGVGWLGMCQMRPFFNLLLSLGGVLHLYWHQVFFRPGLINWLCISWCRTLSLTCYSLPLLLKKIPKHSWKWPCPPFTEMQTVYCISTMSMNLQLSPSIVTCTHCSW